MPKIKVIVEDEGVDNAEAFLEEQKIKRDNEVKEDGN